MAIASFWIKTVFVLRKSNPHCAQDPAGSHYLSSINSILDRGEVLLFNNTFSYHKAECLSNKVQKRKAWALGVIRHTQLSFRFPSY